MSESQRAESNTPGITGEMADFYDLFVDWKGRLGREMPGIEKRLRDNEARRVLDLGCGTGRHVEALLGAGFDAVGADASEDMLRRAAELLGGRARLHTWRAGDEPPARLLSAAPFDAVICMGNTWPQFRPSEDLARTAASLKRLLRPGGLVLLGLKAFAVRQAEGNPYMPLLRRDRDGTPYWFVRFVEFDVDPLEDGSPLCEMHMTVVCGDTSGEAETKALLHRAGRSRVWSPDGLVRWFEQQGFERVRVGSRLDDPEAPVAGEDVYLEAVAPSP